MPNWNQILDELKEAGGTHDVIRRKYLKRLAKLTGRNVILYYSGWLQKPGLRDSTVNDADKNGFMTVIHKLDRDQGLDLLLHTPGGEIAATESIVHYLRSMFGTNIRAIIPHLAMSAGTMIACSCEKIVMGKQSSLGPIDPQLNGIAAHGILEEVERAYREIKQDPLKAVIWQPIIQKYHPTLVGECEKAIKWAESLAAEWMTTGMFRRNSKAASIVRTILKELGDHALNLNHARHLSIEKCREIGLEIIALEDDPALQDAVLSVHHTCIHTLSATNAFKIIENHLGTAFIQAIQKVVLQQP